MRPQKWWTWLSPQKGTTVYLSNSDEMVDWSQPAGGDLEDPPVLDPHIREFLSEIELHLVVEGMNLISLWPLSHPLMTPRSGWGGMPAKWQIPTWWPELVKIPTSRDPISFAKWVWASFQFPKAKCLQKGENDHTPPPAPHCIEWDAFLPQSEGNYVQARTTGSGNQGRPWQFTKALQFWDGESPAAPDWQTVLTGSMCLKISGKQWSHWSSFTDADVLANDTSLTLEEDNIFEKFQRRGRGD